MSETSQDPIWERIRAETEKHAQEEPLLVSFLHASILNHNSLECALSVLLAQLLDSSAASSLMLREIMLKALREDANIRQAIRLDLQAGVDRDSASHELYIPFL